MRSALLAALVAGSLILLVAQPVTADILIDFENTPDGALMSYSEQGVTFTALDGGKLTSNLLGPAPNGTRGIIGLPIKLDGEGGPILEDKDGPPLVPPPPAINLDGGTSLALVQSAPEFPGGDGEGEGGDPPFYFPAIRADFDFLASFVCVELGDDFKDEEKIFLHAYGADDTSLAWVMSFPGGEPGEMKLLAIEYPGIKYVIFGATDPSKFGSSVFADNFTVRTVPEPGMTTVILLGLGLGMGGIRQRRKKRRLAGA